MKKTNVRLFWVLGALIALLAGIQPVSFAASATPESLVGLTKKNSGAGCAGAACHDISTSTVTVKITGGKSTLTPGETSVYTVTATSNATLSNAKMGMAVAASDGTLSESAASLVVASTGEIIHSGPTACASCATGSYQFSYTMPPAAAGGSTHTLYAVARLGAGSGATSTGGWAHATSFPVTTVTVPSLTSAAPPAGKVGVAYSHTYTATGSPAPTFALVSGSVLPPGLALAANGVLSGTPTAAGTFSGSVRASNVAGTSPGQAYSITITAANTAPVITSAAPPATGTVGVAYSHTYTATGNPAPTFARTGSLPPGLALVNGVLSGTPTAAGTFSGTVTASNGVGPGANQPFSITIAPAATSSANYTGLWWKPSESGWGINFAHQDDIIFATWFTYGADGKPLWFIILAFKTAPNVYTGDVSTDTGPRFDSVPFPPNVNVDTVVGTATITFSADGGSATFAYTVNGISQTKTIVREEFASPQPTCVWGALADLRLATNYQDLWWATDGSQSGGSESGWGINFNHQGNIIFATWFTYDTKGKAWWLVIQGDPAGPKVYSGTVYAVTGPPFSAVPFNPNLVDAVPVGNATITIIDGNHARFDYTVNGVTQSKNLVRQVLVGPGTACH